MEGVTERAQRRERQIHRQRMSPGEREPRREAVVVYFVTIFEATFHYPCLLLLMLPLTPGTGVSTRKQRSLGTILDTACHTPPKILASNYN